MTDEQSGQASGLDLDLQTAEGEMIEAIGGPSERVVLGVLDGTTPPSEWVTAIAERSILVLDVQGDVSELTDAFAQEVRDLGGRLMHFRGFLIVAPPGVDLDTDRL